MCQAAKLNLPPTAVYIRHNCNVYLSIQDKVNVAAFGLAEPCCGESAQEQAIFAKRTQLRYIANEMYLPAELDYENYRYVTILRDPWKRYRRDALFPPINMSKVS